MKRRATPPLTSDREKLEAQAAAIHEKLSHIRDKEQREESQKMVGRYFKYRNCYSCPQEPSDYWWLYVKVTGMGDYHAKAIRFQTDKYGKMDVETTTFFNSGGYVEIDAKEYNAAWRKFQKQIAGLK